MTLTPSPTLLTDLQSTLNAHNYQLTHAVINSKQENHRYLFTDKKTTIKLEIAKA